MKIIKYFSCLCLALFFFSCSGNLEPVSSNNNDNDIVNYTGTITEGYCIQSDVAYQGNLDLFYPVNLSEEYKKNGLRIIFSAKFIGCPPASCCYAPEIKLSAIRIIK
jgi:hypothetical protein